MRIIGIIPARYGSTRFPGKPLLDIRGTSMIMRVYKQALKTSLFSDVYVATDDDRIFNHVNENGGKVVMTGQHHKTGTERCFEACYNIMNEDVEIKSDDVIINIQGDEPFIAPEQINELASCFTSDDVVLATLVKSSMLNAEIESRDVVKVVFNINNDALYFSRSLIPFYRKEKDEQKKYYKHVGIYAYRYSTLKEIVKLPMSQLEIIESLEQLRWIENGYKIKIKLTNYDSVSIDTPEDLNQVDSFL